MPICVHFYSQTSGCPCGVEPRTKNLENYKGCFVFFLMYFT